MENEKLFPFNTCEKPKESGIAQPYSVCINIVSCLIILYYLVQSKSISSFCFVFSFLCFQVFHAFSHSIHIPNSIQNNVIHVIAYFVNLFQFNLFYQYTHHFPGIWFLVSLFFLVWIDLSLFFFMDSLYYILSQIFIFLFIILSFYRYFPRFLKKAVFSILFFSVILSLLLVNEKINCSRILDWIPHFPLHIFVELIGLIITYLIISTFYKL